jgi:outer membrane lipoprotein-sorting protein
MARLQLVVLGTLLLGTGITPRLGAAQSTPREIVEKSESLRQIDNSIQTVRMTLVSKSGNQRVREFRLKVRRDPDAVRSHTEFLSPADVAGTAMVIVDRPDQIDEQMLYVPALKRVTRISGRARSGSFLGSDFSFEDLEVSNADDARHTLKSEDDVAWVIETIPGADSSYGRIVSTVRKSDHLPIKVEYFDARSNPLKTLTVTATLESNGATYPKTSEMVDLKKGTRTLLEVEAYRVDVPPEELPDTLFSQTALERGG